MLEQRPGIPFASDQGERVDEPKRAGEKGSLRAGDAVDLTAGPGRVAEENAIANGQFVADGIDGSRQPRVRCRQEADKRDPEQARVEFLPATWVPQLGVRLVTRKRAVTCGNTEKPSDGACH